MKMDGVEDVVVKTAVHGFVFFDGFREAEDEIMLLEELGGGMVLLVCFKEDVEIFVLALENVIALKEEVVEIMIVK